MTDPTAFTAAIEAGRRRRDELRQQRQRVALGASAAVVAVWLVFTTLGDHWDRVADQWAAAVTMIFGSFVAGSTPQGGGAVAFPVFTKLLDVDTSVARSFSLLIQAIGMGTAAVTIVVTRRLVEWRAVAVALPAAIAGFLLGLYLLGRPSDPFWPSRVSGPYVKVTFTLLIAGMAVVVYAGYRVHLLERLVAMPVAGPRVIAALVVGGLVGGVASSLVGSGSDVLVYLVIVVLVGLSPRVGVATSVVVMAAVSVVGLVLLGIVDGQLDVTLGPGGDVVAIGGETVSAVEGGAVVHAPGTPLDAGRYDLYGMWLAAVPVVALAAPLGSWAVSKTTDRQLARFVVVLAAAETLSTVAFLDGLVRRPDGALILYAVAGGVAVIGGIWWLQRSRRRVLGLPGVDVDRAFTRSRLDPGPRYRQQLSAPPDEAATEEGGAGDEDR